MNMREFQGLEYEISLRFARMSGTRWGQLYSLTKFERGAQLLRSGSLPASLGGHCLADSSQLCIHGLFAELGHLTQPVDLQKKHGQKTQLMYFAIVIAIFPTVSFH